MIREALTESYVEDHYFLLDTETEVTIIDEAGEEMESKILPADSEWEMYDDSYLEEIVHLDGLTTGETIRVTMDDFLKKFIPKKWHKGIDF